MNNAGWIVSRICYAALLFFLALGLMRRSKKEFWHGFADGLVWSVNWIGTPLAILTVIHYWVLWHG